MPPRSLPDHDDDDDDDGDDDDDDDDGDLLRNASARCLLPSASSMMVSLSCSMLFS